ncbi:unnamed protein product [Oikopleura dioica]|uniref:Uncharacterized protein n=1 Tax=Oikopleura dioica TaxID=34765 RepID=E4WR30_OIKDI|nr:unnamed protein product [Oikopleura dioica]
MFGGAKTVLPSFRLKKKRKVTPPPADVAHKLLRTDSIDSDPPRDLSMTMPKRNRRGRPKIKNEDCGRINNEQQNERLCNNNKVVPKTTKTHLELCPFPQISEEFSIGWVCKSENADGEVCKRTFLDKNDITAHINLHHKKSKVKKFLKVKIRKAFN